MVALTLGTFCIKSLSLSLSAGAGRAGQSPRRDSQALCLTSSGRVLVFLCVRWFSNSTYFICLFEPWRRQPGAGLPSPRQEGLRVSWSPKLRTSHRRRAAGPYFHARFRARKHQNAQTGLQTQLRPHWTKHRVCRFSTSLLGTTVAICDARLARLVSRDDDAELPAAPLVHGIVTPWAQVGGRCRKWAVSTQHKHICGKTKLWDSTPSGVSLATADLPAVEQASNDKDSS